MPRYYGGKRSAPNTAHKDFLKAKAAAQARTLPLVVATHESNIRYIGSDTADTGRAFLPVRLSPTEWESKYKDAPGPEAVAAATQAHNAAVYMRDIERRPKRVEDREKLIAARNSLAEATGIPFVAADRVQEQRFQLARFMDAFAESEIEFRNERRKFVLDSIVAESLKILINQFQYDVRRIQAHVLERFKS